MTPRRANGSATAAAGAQATAKGAAADLPRAAAELTDRERAYIDGALVIALAVDSALVDGAASAWQAFHALAAAITAGSAPAELIQAVKATNLRPRAGDLVGGTGGLIQRMRRIHARFRRGQACGDVARYLAPAKPAGGTQARDADVRAFLTHYCKPSRPTVVAAWRESAAWYESQQLVRPAVDTFHRIERRLPVTQKLRGRMLGPAWHGLLPYVSRDVSMFRANDIWVGDGHTFKARIQHPIHGHPFRPEITAIIDWVSRKVIGWSVDLAESTVAVSAAFRHAQMQTRARPLVYYSDNGAGQTGKVIDCPIYGTLARQGIAHETGIPGNPKGRGVIERLWQTTLIPLASRYPTFMGDRADKAAVRSTGIALEKARRAGITSELLPTWPQFLADLADAFKHYNAHHQHTSLGGATPDEEFARRADPDADLCAADDADIAALWLPEVARTPRRGLVQLFGNAYAAPDLVHTLAEGEPVRVRFDIHDASRVWLRRLDGRDLGTAAWNGHRVAAFPVPYIEQLRAERAERKRQRAHLIIAQADAELCGPALTQGLPTAPRNDPEPAPPPARHDAARSARRPAPVLPAMPDLFERDQQQQAATAAAATWSDQLRDQLRKLATEADCEPGANTEAGAEPARRRS